MPGRAVHGGDRGVTCQNFSSGLAAVWADRLERQSIFEALRNRVCYGTTGVRMIVEFFANGAPMGQQVTLSGPEQPRRITGQVIGTDQLRRVELFRNNQQVHLFDIHQTDHVTLEWTDTAALSGPSWYYLRATQADYHRAWTSPIWFTAG